MAGSRLIIWARDTPRFQRGDVVDVLPKGMFAGKGVEGDPDWIIIEVEGDPKEHSYLLAEARYEDGMLALHRAVKIDVDNPKHPVVQKKVPPHPNVIR